MHILCNQWIVRFKIQFTGTDCTMTTNFHIEKSLRFTASIVNKKKEVKKNEYFSHISSKVVAERIFYNFFVFLNSKWNLTVLSLSVEIPQMAYDVRQLMLSANQFVPNVMPCQSNIDGMCRRYFSRWPIHDELPSLPKHALQEEKRNKNKQKKRRNK